MSLTRTTVALLAACANTSSSSSSRSQGDPYDLELESIGIGSATSQSSGLLVPPPDIALESSWCWFLGPIGGQLGVFVVGMDSGTVHEHSRYGSNVNDSLHTAGMAYTGSAIVAGIYDGDDFLWHELDLATGALTVGPPDGIGTNKGVSWLPRAGLVAITDQGPSRLDLYEDFSSLISGTPKDWLPVDGQYSRFQLDGAALYTAWHADDELLVYDALTGNQKGTIPLESYDTWVWGIGVAGGMLHLIDDGRSYASQGTPRIARFDMQGYIINGVEVAGFSRARRPSGLWCDAPDARQFR